MAGRDRVHHQLQRPQHGQRLPVRVPLQPLRQRVSHGVRHVRAEHRHQRPRRRQRPAGRLLRAGGGRGAARQDGRVGEGQRQGVQEGSGGDPAQVRAVPSLQRVDVPRAVLEREEGALQQCAPDLGVEMAAAQADKSVEEVWAHAKMAEEDKHLTEQDWREGITASCPSRALQGDERQVLRPVRCGPQGRQALHAVRRQARAQCEVLLRPRLSA